jgi:hypothetical protein
MEETHLPQNDLGFDINRQPDDTTCGPTCLHAVYRYYGDTVSLQDVIAETHQLPDGGTLSVWLACHALQRGYQTTIYPFGLQIFDPTWADLSPEILAQKLLRQLEFKKEKPGFRMVTEAYLEYLRLGGVLKFEEMTAGLIRRHLKKSMPILTGLSATHLYGSAREVYEDGRSVFDDLRGESVGHFVVLAGYNRDNRTVLVADPLEPNPVAHGRYYAVNIYRLIGAILLGILTYDGNLLVIRKRKRQGQFDSTSRKVGRF